MLSLGVIAYVLYLFVFQTINVALAVFIGGLGTFYFMQHQLKAQRNAELKGVIAHWNYFITKCLERNERFQTHRMSSTLNPTHPWDSLLYFYEFHALPLLASDKHLFSLHQNTEPQLSELLIEFTTHVLTLTKALDELHQYHEVYLEKRNIWESKIKSIKGLRDLNTTDLTVLKNTIGSSLVNRLVFLTDSVIEHSNALNTTGAQLKQLLSPRF